MRDDQLDRLIHGLHAISESITPLDALPARLENGVQVGCLTEAALAIASALDNVAEAIRMHAEGRE